MRWLTAILLALSTAAWAVDAEVTVAWDPNPPEEMVTGYKIHSGPAAGSYTKAVDVGNVTRGVILAPVGSQTHLVVTAYNGYGLSSDYSAEVIVTPQAPVTVSVVNGVASLSGIPPGWTTVANADGSYTLAPPRPPEVWLVAPHGSYPTRPVVDPVLYLGGIRREVGRVPVGSPCGAQAGTNPAYRAVTSISGVAGVGYCVLKP